MSVMTDGKHATATSESRLSTTPFKSEAGVWFVIPSISVGTFSTSIWKTIKAEVTTCRRVQDALHSLHLSHAKSADAYGRVVIGTCSFPLNSESVQAWLAAKPAWSRRSTGETSYDAILSVQ